MYHSLALLTRFDVCFKTHPHIQQSHHKLIESFKMVKKLTYPPQRYQHIETIYIYIYIYHHISPLISPIQKIPIDWKSMGVTPNNHPPTSWPATSGHEPSERGSHLGKATWGRPPGEGHLVATWSFSGGFCH